MPEGTDIFTTTVRLLYLPESLSFLPISLIVHYGMHAVLFTEPVQPAAFLLISMCLNYKSLLFATYLHPSAVDTAATFTVRYRSAVERRRKKLHAFTRRKIDMG